jgi:beta-lactamase regulating signal transducer with metallopeptidase domain/predicted  nucleic acid-binding Zn-ribbon protein
MDANSPILLLLKATLLLGVAFAAVRWERNAPAVRRHGVWSVTFVALLALPLLALSIPGIHIPVPAWRDAITRSRGESGESGDEGRLVTSPPTPRLRVTQSDVSSSPPSPRLRVTQSDVSSSPPSPRLRVTQSDVSSSPTSPRLRVTQSDVSSSPTSPRLRVTQSDVRPAASLDSSNPIDNEINRARVNVAQVLIVVWLAGVAAALLALVRSLLRVRRLVASGRYLDDFDWLRAAQRIARQLGLDTVPRLLVSNSVSAPMAGNVGQAIVFLPANADQWDSDRRDVVLTHEMTHLARKDPLRILAARIACALYWFHPLMWLAARRSTADCEQACDESVLALGIRPSVYARVLLDFAHQAPASVPSVALPIVRRHRLENRVMAILSNPGATPRRTTSPRRTRLTALGSMALIASLAAARPATVEAVSKTGSVPTAPEVRQPETAPVSPALVATPATTPKVREASVPAATVLTTQDGSCWNAYSRARSFSGSSSTSYGDRLIQRIGRIDRDRIAQMTFGELRVCMVTFGYDGSDAAEAPSEWIGHADRIIMETERENDVRRLEIDGGRSSWFINGRSAAIDDGAGAWRRAMLDLLDTSWEISTLRGQESSLRGEISSVQGERSSLLGEISSLRGEVSSMQGEISSLRGEESSLRGEISSIRGHESSLRGQISSERGAISSLESQRWERGADRDAINARIRRHEDNIRDIERELDRYDTDARVRAVEREIATLDTDRKVAAVERRIREFDVEQKVAEVEKELAKLNVDRQVRGIETEIRDLNVDTRVRDMTAQREAALDRLRRVLGIR